MASSSRSAICSTSVPDPSSATTGDTKCVEIQRMLSHGTRLVYTLLASFADTFRIKIRSPMADPFSIVVGTIGVIEVCVHLGKYLQDVKAGAEEIVEEVEALFHEVGALRSVNESIKTTFEAEITQPPDVTERDLKNVENLWRNTGSILKDCQSTLTKLHDLIVQVEGKDGPKLLAKLDGLRKHLRKRSKEEDFLQIRRKLSNYHSALQVVLTALNM
jgi:hypothetical protein